MESMEACRLWMRELDGAAHGAYIIGEVLPLFGDDPDTLVPEELLHVAQYLRDAAGMAALMMQKEWEMEDWTRAQL